MSHTFYCESASLSTLTIHTTFDGTRSGRRSQSATQHAIFRCSQLKR